MVGLIKELYIVSFGCYRKHFWILLGLLTIFYFTTDAFMAYLEMYYIDAEDFRTSIRYNKLLDQWILIISDAAMVYVVIQYLSKKELGFGEAFGRGFGLYWKMWLTRFMSYLSYLTLLLLIFPGIYLIVRWSFAEIAVVADGRCGTSAFGRSWELTRGKFWKVLVVGLMGLLPLVVGVIFIFGSYWFLPEDNWVLDAGLSMSISLLISFHIIYLTAFYGKLGREQEEASHSETSQVADQQNSDPEKW